MRCRVNFLHECAELGFAPDIAFATDDNLVVQSLVAEGLGVAMMPGLVLSFMRLDRVTGKAAGPRLPPQGRGVRAARPPADPGRGPGARRAPDGRRAAQRLLTPTPSIRRGTAG